MRYFSQRSAQGTVDYRKGNQTGRWEGCVGGVYVQQNVMFNNALPNTYDSLYDPNLLQQSLIKARLKMKKADVNLGVAFAERNATARLLGDTARRIATAFRKLKKGQVRAAMRELGIANERGTPRGSNIPGKWLELQYGWKPLLSDVYGACDALSRQPDGNWRVTAKAQVKSQKVGGYFHEGFTGGRFTGSCAATAELGAFTRIDALPSNDLIMSLASLGITNPLLIAWELVPFSFVVDWSLHVGEWLDSLDSLLGYEQAMSSSSAFMRGRWTIVGTRYLDQTDGSTWDNRWKGHQDVVEVRRTASLGVPLPTFPRIRDPGSLGHMANGLALLTSSFGRR